MQQESEAGESAVLVPRAMRPVLTYALILLLVAVFALELVVNEMIGGPASEISPGTLLLLGASARKLIIDDQQYYRLFSAPLLHLGYLHLLMNCYALFIIGSILEPLVGRLWFGAIYLLSGLCGVVMSIAVMPGYILSAGASGSIVGLFAAGLLAGRKLPEGPSRSRLMSTCGQVLVLSLLPLIPVPGGAKVDYGAHLGGALAGALLGFIAADVASAGKTPGRLNGLAVAICVLVGIGTAYAAVAIGMTSGRAIAEANVSSRLITRFGWLNTLANDVTAQKGWLTKYPSDPRGHMLQGCSLMAQGKFDDAERAFQTAQDKYERVKQGFQPIVGSKIDAMLAAARKHTDPTKAGSDLCLMLNGTKIYDQVGQF